MTEVGASKTPEQGKFSGKALASGLLGLASVWMALLNIRPVTSGGFLISLLLSGASLVLAVWAVVDIGRRRKKPSGLIAVLAGIGAAALGLYLSWGFRVFQETTDRRVQVSSQLRRLALALLHYEQAHGRFPPAAVYSEDGRPLLSWRVLILPHLEQEGIAEPGLFQRFKLEEPWDSPHNRRLLERMPHVFAPPRGVDTLSPFTTYYQVLVGKGTAFEGNQGIRLDDFWDGTEKTFLVVEASRAVPWTKPEDLPYAPGRPLPRLGVFSRAGFSVSFADGGVEFLRRETPEDTIRALITRKGGDLPGDGW